MIHCAGVLRDGLLINKTDEALHAVLAPKVDGAVCLDEATRGEPLDFFVLCSSLAAVSGSAGQTDYALANAFLDHFAAWRQALTAAGRRNGVTRAINWPLWQDGGMRLADQATERLAETIGLRALRSDEGIRALEACLRAEWPSVQVLCGDVGRIQRMWGGAGDEAGEPASARPVVDAPGEQASPRRLS